MTKPILIVYYAGIREHRHEVWEELKSNEELSKDYHFVIVQLSESESHKIEVLNADHLDPIDIESLKAKLKLK